ncbi:GNAT family N-acetyltransferase [Candidatus Bathyarchaeota archaeon]|nr:MAG: GNAT family N-acetyltransferase [Candidatus Bathyarchaeota archaeon]
MLSLRLLPMTRDDFDEWKSRSIKDYADEKVKAGNWTAEEAPRLAEQTFASILPKGFSTQDHHFFSIQNLSPGEKVGVVWYSINREGKRPFAYIWDFAIFEQHRRRGYASEALNLLEERVREQGLDTISLHVFGHNHPARELYQKSGYVATNVNMSKKIA